MDEILKRNLDAAIDAAIAEQRVVGTVVVVLRDGAPIYRRAAGFADRETRAPMQLDTVFRLSSITKPIVTLAAMRLVDAGTLELDAPVARYLPEFRPKLGERERSPTIRQLLTHTAGLSYGFMQPEGGPYAQHGVSDGLDSIRISMAEELRRIAAAGLFYEPGSQWIYSLGIDVVGAVIEQVTGQPLPAAIEALVTHPLELAHTSFRAPADRALATPYADGQPPLRMGDVQHVPFAGLAGLNFYPGRVYDQSGFASGGGGMNGTADEVARVLELVRSGGGRLLQPESARAMLTNQTGSLPVILGPGWGFGFGGAVLLDPAAANTPQSAGTWTWSGVWGHNWFVDPVQRLVVVGLTNTALEGMLGQFPNAVRDAVYLPRT